MTQNLAWFGTLLSAALILTIPAASAAQHNGVDIQVIGAHRVVNGDTPESARQLAVVDAHRQAVRAAVKTLSSQTDVAAIKLSPIELDAYVSALIELEDSPATGTPATPPTAREGTGQRRARHRAGFTGGPDAARQPVR